MYNPASTVATEFIDHDEILNTIEYAREKACDTGYIRSLIEKSKECKGLSHQEAASLLECTDLPKIGRASCRERV